MARCPAHQDRNPSLSIATGRNGQILVHCHAGCTQKRVIAALRDHGIWREQRAVMSSIIATYSYTNETGGLLYQIVKFAPKNFFQRRPDGAGGWIWRKGERQVLYRLSEVLESPIVFLVEGEKDCETMRDHGFVATTNAGGAEAPWLDSYTEALRGREVIIIPDNDQPGWARAARISRALFKAAAKVKVFDLPHRYKDISDWFAAGHSECELIARLEGPNAI
jgi:DNA primase